MIEYITCHMCGKEWICKLNESCKNFRTLGCACPKCTPVDNDDCQPIPFIKIKEQVEFT